MEHAYTNELINETSPYLLQHAHNPVEWHAWSKQALEKASQLDKPILVSIGYAACHWCHVMEKESFENDAVAAYMNEHFINIKIDREERPDLDHIYMDAVQAIAGNGGWPLNVFLTTDAKPFYGGTYFPPVKAFNRSSWMDVLFYIVDAWTNRRQEVEQQATTLLEHINSSSGFISNNIAAEHLSGDHYFTEEKCKLIAGNMLNSADNLNGGFGGAPKFPQTFNLQYLLAYGHQFNEEKALQHAEFSLQQLINGGIYDQLAGGMARYSTDAQWLAPHFEKMLYDNALLVGILCDAFQITGNDFYKKAIEKTLQFFLDEMHHPEGGFYAALDADSEGVEGKFYVWDISEINKILGKDSAIFCNWYDVTEQGNWEHKNILNVKNQKEIFSKENGTSVQALNSLLHVLENKLLTERNKRIRPATDDKILLGWNALLLTAFCKASAALGSEVYKEHAVNLFNFLIEKFSEGDMIVHHSYKNNQARHPAFLDDYAYLIQSCVLLQELTSDQQYLQKAKALTAYVISQFHCNLTGFFFYSNAQQQDLITRKIEVYDNAIPSGNSIMAENLFYLSVIFNNREWWLMANKMMVALSDIIIKHPTSFGVWSNLVLKQAIGMQEIAITGKNAGAIRAAILKLYLPRKVLQSAANEEDMPLLKNKIYGESPLIYVCTNYSCGAPVTNMEDFKLLMKNS